MILDIFVKALIINTQNTKFKNLKTHRQLNDNQKLYLVIN